MLSLHNSETATHNTIYWTAVMHWFSNIDHMYECATRKLALQEPANEQGVVSMPKTKPFNRVNKFSRSMTGLLGASPHHSDRKVSRVQCVWREVLLVLLKEHMPEQIHKYLRLLHKLRRSTNDYWRSRLRLKSMQHAKHWHTNKEDNSI